MHPKHSVLEVTVRANYELCADPSQGGSVRHIELETAATNQQTLKYDAADDLAVLCDNGYDLAAKTCSRLGAPLNALLTLRALSSDVPPPLPTPCTALHALRYYADLRASPKREFLLLLAQYSSNDAEAERLRYLATPSGKAEFSEYIVREGRGATELLDEFASSSPPFGHFLELVPKLTPRYYTISSSPTMDATSVHMTVKILREAMNGAPHRQKEGVCTTQLEGMKPGDRIAVFVRASAFRLPASSDAPVIMIGPGTGIAPFRAFLQELSCAAKNGRARSGHTRLYFGCRKRSTDYLYSEMLSDYVKAGHLSSLRVAFSREQAKKVYVQDLLKADGSEVWKLLANEGAHLYVCGGTAMGRDVLSCVQEMACTHGGMSASASADFVKHLTQRGRLVQELWS